MCAGGWMFLKGEPEPEKVCCVCTVHTRNGNPARQPDLFTPFYSCLLAIHILFQYINIVVEPADTVVTDEWIFVTKTLM